MEINLSVSQHTPLDRGLLLSRSSVSARRYYFPAVTEAALSQCDVLLLTAEPSSHLHEYGKHLTSSKWGEQEGKGMNRGGNRIAYNKSELLRGEDLQRHGLIHSPAKHM
jgi:hypothetical protein